MLSSMSPKERAIYAAIGIVGLAGIGFWGGRQLRKPPEIRIGGPSVSNPQASTNQPLFQRPGTAKSGGTPTTLPVDLNGAAPAPNSKIVVHVVGAVKKPGLYDFHSGDRVSDAIRLAGGSLADADLESVNLAAKLEDGTQLRILKKSQANMPQALADLGTYGGDNVKAGYASKSGGSGGGELSPGSISLNTASESELDRLPGIGPSTARKILDYRRQVGGFTSINEALNVKGIGPKKLAAMRKYLRL